MQDIKIIITLSEEDIAKEHPEMVVAEEMTTTAEAEAEQTEETQRYGTDTAIRIIQLQDGRQRGIFSIQDFLLRHLPEADKEDILFQTAIRMQLLLVLAMHHGQETSADHGEDAVEDR